MLVLGGSMDTVQLGVHSGVVCLNGYLLSAPSLQGFMLLGMRRKVMCDPDPYGEGSPWQQEKPAHPLLPGESF